MGGTHCNFIHLWKKIWKYTISLIICVYIHGGERFAQIYLSRALRTRERNKCLAWWCWTESCSGCAERWRGTESTEPSRSGAVAAHVRDRADVRSIARNGAAGSPRSRGMDPRTARSRGFVMRDRPRSRLRYARDRIKLLIGFTHISQNFAAKHIFCSGLVRNRKSKLLKLGVWKR